MIKENRFLFEQSYQSWSCVHRAANKQHLACKQVWLVVFITTVSSKDYQNPKDSNSAREPFEIAIDVFVHAV